MAKSLLMLAGDSRLEQSGCNGCLEFKRQEEVGLDDRAVVSTLARRRRYCWLPAARISSSVSWKRKSIDFHSPGKA